MLKSLPKIITIFFLIIFVFQLACLLFLTFAPSIGQAASATFKPQVQIPGMEQEFGATDKTGSYAIPGSTASIAKYVRVVYKYAIGIVGILAAVVLMIGGVMWIMAGGSATMIGEAKTWIGASLTGLVLALLSYLILATINPALVDFKTTGIKNVENNSMATSNECSSDQHLDYQLQDYIYSCGTVSIETCRCVAGSGSNVCTVKNQAKQCKLSGTQCGTSDKKDTCEVKKCCAECCSQKCKEGGGLMGVNQILCE